MKERLIGAVVLVLLAVWLIPWLLNGVSDAPEPQAVALSLPAAQDAAPVKTHTIDLDAERRSERAAEPASVPAGTAALPSPKPVESPSASRLAPPRAAEKVAGGPDSTSPSAAAKGVEGDWSVQLGSFGEPANAERLAARVATYGFDADVSAYRAGGRVMHRVRIGPQATRAQAEAVASSLSAHGFVAQVVTAD